MPEVISPFPSLVRMYPTTNANLEPFSNSKLIAVNQCPTWGIIRYGHQKAYETDARSMALEAGTAMHDVFATVRLWQLGRIQGKKKLANTRAAQLFGKERWENAQSEQSDDRDNLMELCFNILHTTGFYDDDRDSIRTIANMEGATLRYVDERLDVMENWPIYLGKDRSGDVFVGIEQTVDVTLEYGDGTKIRYIGTIDGVTVKKHDGAIHLEENKTAVRLDEGWRQSFEMTHQITGYCALGSTILNTTPRKARVMGLKIKQTGSHDDFILFEPMDRSEDSILKWAAWVYYTVAEYYKFRDKWEHAPRFTHSCNRYFRPCSMIPFCADSPEGRYEQFLQMITADPTPSEKAVAEIF